MKKLLHVGILSVALMLMLGTGLSTDVAVVGSDQAAKAIPAPPAVDKIGDIDLPYYGPGVAMYDPDDEAWYFSFTDEEALGSGIIAGIAYGFCGESAAPPVRIDEYDVYMILGQMEFEIENGMLFVTICNDDDVLDMTFEMFGLEDAVEQGAIAFDPPSFVDGEEDCPGGSCSCSGRQGPCEACCSEGYHPFCRCTADVSTCFCKQNKQAIEIESIEYFLE